MITLNNNSFRWHRPDHSLLIFGRNAQHLAFNWILDDKLIPLAFGAIGCSEARLRAHGLLLFDLQHYFLLWFLSRHRKLTYLILAAFLDLGVIEVVPEALRVHLLFDRLLGVIWEDFRRFLFHVDLIEVVVLKERRLHLDVHWVGLAATIY